ncbi:elongator complex protein 4-like [Agrilus planipennis]|uniref:Elongator complex protein 4 n=1 Tax=Agrilus planipennis TaxID=224129 RepID=A0A7F5R8L7_AGRPL|nr:elongator complex protein 4-like [Agrilus planipennis]
MEQKTEQRKTIKSILSIPGTRANVQSGQLLVSSGIPSVDELLGGGLPVGSVVLIEEDSGGSYSRVMLRYFLAEGVVHKHAVFVGSQDYNPGKMIQSLSFLMSTKQIK